MSCSREIYFSSEALRKLRELRVGKLESCIHCHWRYLCGGDCRALALFATGRISSARKPEELISSMFKERSIEFEVSNCTQEILKLVEGISGISKFVKLGETEENTSRFVIYT